MLPISASRTRRHVLPVAVAALLAVFAVSASANAATTDQASSGSAATTSLSSSYSWGATALNFAQPGDTEFHFVRKAGG